ncbi:MAG: YoaK family protein [Agrobacterium vaccinii]
MTIQRRRRIIRTRRTSLGVTLVAAISFLAGLTDAIGLQLSGDFVSFMTGNTTRAAISFEQGDYIHALVLVGAIVTFVIGNALGIIVAHLFERRIFAVLTTVGLLLAVASALAAPELAIWRFNAVVLAMGLVNAAVEHIEGLPIGLTYVTGALSRLGRGIGRTILGERNFGWTVQIVPWLGMAAGALCGAALAIGLPDQALQMAAWLTLGFAAVTLFIPRSLQHRYNQRPTPSSNGLHH